MIEQRDQGNGNTAGEVSRHADPLEAEAIHEGAAEQGGEKGEGGNGGSNPRFGGTAGGLEHEPGHGEGGELAADERGRVGGKQGNERDTGAW